ncbi:alginate lyase family protein [Nonlabens ponticola]|uniref:Alginate lyase family protein n=1 Tax=Nonlabens ponticola TaxID=2496866 RepID=A0A3S9MZU2_9FLAO|nr:alginate lyase family protein [Nonlabens ponticola]AZQ44690.1 alginate lyase family protein [Nonlabens ponticola]
MFNKALLVVDFVKNMGWRYVFFRLWHLFQVKSGLFQKKFPAHPEFRKFVTLEQWRSANIPFLISSREELDLPKQLNDDLELRFRESVKNNITFFNSQKFQLDKETQWKVNPSNDYLYDSKQHWSKIADLSAEAGDIKFVWEKARFSYLYDIIRYDYHSDTDQAEFVFKEIEDFIDKNPINLGPQYKCSQEISLRVLNWTYALFYYKNSKALTEDRFLKLMNSIYWQLHHVRKNINFSRIAVRNNHAITETLMLYLSGLLFPFIPETKQWSKSGKKWFEQEIEYQIYEDGTFLQYSMNYHRVVVQLLTWAIRLANLNQERFKDVVYQRASRSLAFLDACIDHKSGKLPNYGSNDGALFFKFTDDDYRVYTSQLNDLRVVLTGKATAVSESYAWYGINDYELIEADNSGTFSFKDGGYYICNENNELKTFLRCGSYKDRPAQADNLHLDIWVDGINYLWDNGSYKYNTSQQMLQHFMGSAGHNTLTINRQNHMLKGGRFIWYYWVKKASAIIEENKNKLGIVASMMGYRQLSGIKMTRTVKKKKLATQWSIQDFIENTQGRTVRQHWHINPKVSNRVTITSRDENGIELKPEYSNSWHSSYYGVKEPATQIIFSHTGRAFDTTININHS